MVWMLTRCACGLNQTAAGSAAILPRSVGAIGDAWGACFGHLETYGID